MKGADRKNPQRYRSKAPKSGVPLGNAPAHLSASEQAAWFELQSYALPGVLTGADRTVMEMGARLLAESRDNWLDFSAAKIGHLVGILARLGMSPADRQKLGTADGGDENPFDAI